MEQNIISYVNVFTLVIFLLAFVKGGAKLLQPQSFPAKVDVGVIEALLDRLLDLLGSVDEFIKPVFQHLLQIVVVGFLD